MNSALAKFVLASLNPGMHFEVGDVNRLPLFPIASANDIFATVERAFAKHESHREPSLEFRNPGPSPWRHAQDWAQQAVDRPEGDPLPAYVEELDPEPAIDHLSFALGVALGRFGSKSEGILDPARDDLSHALPAGILFINTTLDSNDLRDSLREPPARPLLDAWRQYGPEIKPGGDLRDYLATEFFEHHRKQYENRPIHWPLSSEQRSFIAWVTIHRWDASTLRVLLADHLQPALNDIEGELRDIRAAQVSGDKKAVKAAEKRLARVKAARVELQEFIAAVEQCAEKGPPPPDPKRPEREVDARYDPDLDDGVMINAAALWPLFPVKQWKDPRKWWKELASPDPKKNYDWSHLAMRYWPTRVDERCKTDPSLGVAHGCFWRYHPPRAWSWELRLQDEIGPEFRIVEDPILAATAATRPTAPNSSPPAAPRPSACSRPSCSAASASTSARSPPTPSNTLACGPPTRRHAGTSSRPSCSSNRRPSCCTPTTSPPPAQPFTPSTRGPAASARSCSRPSPRATSSRNPPVTSPTTRTRRTTRPATTTRTHEPPRTCP
jgi:hypothetical protein